VVWLTLPRRGRVASWGPVRADFERALADAACPVIASPVAAVQGCRPCHSSSGQAPLRRGLCRHADRPESVGLAVRWAEWAAIRSKRGMTVRPGNVMFAGLACGVAAGCTRDGW
jgi:hypothetical protein